MVCRACCRGIRTLAAGSSSSTGIRQSSVLRRHQSSTSTSAASGSQPDRPLKLAIIGAGPSGFYAASRILTTLPIDSPEGRNVTVDMYERLPTPYGLVRYGVAPDHPEVKNCQHKFDELSSDPRFTYLGNISVGSQPSSSVDIPSPSTTLSPYTYPHALHLPLSSLLPHYTSLLLTYGASLSNPLSSVPGSSSSPNPLHSVHPALALVGWYNGHPAFRHMVPDLSGEEAVVIGHGNVALDVARILLKRLAELEDTDIPQEVLEVLAESRVRKVTAVGRRGPAQVAFTTKEFREMLNLPDVVYPGLDPLEVEKARPLVEGDRMRKRLLGLMENPSKGSGNKEFHLDFLKSPKAFLPNSNSKAQIQDGRVNEVEWMINQLVTTPGTPSPPDSQAGSVPSSTAVARPTDQLVRTRADMVIESVGYRSEPLGTGEGWVIPFDKSRGRVLNTGGRVIDEAGAEVPGLYAAGWAARGPVGVIASTMHDAYAIASQIMDDHFANTSSLSNTQQPEAGLPQEVQQGFKEGKIVDLKRWERIDAAEKERARLKGSKKEREKFTRVEDMLAV